MVIIFERLKYSVWAKVPQSKQNIQLIGICVLINSGDRTLLFSYWRQVQQTHPRVMIIKLIVVVPWRPFS